MWLALILQRMWWSSPLFKCALSLPPQRGRLSVMSTREIALQWCGLRHWAQVCGGNSRRRLVGTQTETSSSALNVSTIASKNCSNQFSLAKKPTDSMRSPRSATLTSARVYVRVMLPGGSTMFQSLSAWRRNWRRWLHPGWRSRWVLRQSECCRVDWRIHLVFTQDALRKEFCFLLQLSWLRKLSVFGSIHDGFFCLTVDFALHCLPCIL